MSHKFVLCMVLIAVGICGCKKSETNPSRNSAAVSEAALSPSPSASQQIKRETVATNGENRPKTDACSLLNSGDIQAVQGEPLKETKLSGHSHGGFAVSQCFFTLPTFTNSISLSVTQRGEGAGGRDPREFWKSNFGDERGSKDKQEREREKIDREEEESAPPIKVNGVGEEAFWMGGKVGGALYVLKGNRYVRLSVGGKGDQANKIKKSKALAQKVLSRM